MSEDLLLNIRKIFEVLNRENNREKERHEKLRIAAKPSATSKKTSKIPVKSQTKPKKGTQIVAKKGTSQKKQVENDVLPPPALINQHFQSFIAEKQVKSICAKKHFNMWLAKYRQSQVIKQNRNVSRQVGKPSQPSRCPKAIPYQRKTTPKYQYEQKEIEEEREEEEVDDDDDEIDETLEFLIETFNVKKATFLDDPFFSSNDTSREQQKQKQHKKRVTKQTKKHQPKNQQELDEESLDSFQICFSSQATNSENSSRKGVYGKSESDNDDDFLISPNTENQNDILFGLNEIDSIHSDGNVLNEEYIDEGGFEIHADENAERIQQALQDTISPFFGSDFEEEEEEDMKFTAPIKTEKEKPLISESPPTLTEEEENENITIKNTSSSTSFLHKYATVGSSEFFSCEGLYKTSKLLNPTANNNSKSIDGKIINKQNPQKLSEEEEELYEDNTGTEEKAKEQIIPPSNIKLNNAQSKENETQEKKINIVNAKENLNQLQETYENEEESKKPKTKQQQINEEKLQASMEEKAADLVIEENSSNDKSSEDNNELDNSTNSFELHEAEIFEEQNSSNDIQDNTKPSTKEIKDETQNNIIETGVNEVHKNNDSLIKESCIDKKSPTSEESNLISVKHEKINDLPKDNEEPFSSGIGSPGKINASKEPNQKMTNTKAILSAPELDEVPLVKTFETPTKESEHEQADEISFENDFESPTKELEQKPADSKDNDILSKSNEISFENDFGTPTKESEQKPIDAKEIHIDSVSDEISFENDFESSTKESEQKPADSKDDNILSKSNEVSFENDFGTPTKESEQKLIDAKEIHIDSDEISFENDFESPTKESEQKPADSKDENIFSESDEVLFENDFGTSTKGSEQKSINKEENPNDSELNERSFDIDLETSTKDQETKLSNKEENDTKMDESIDCSFSSDFES